MVWVPTGNITALAAPLAAFLAGSTGLGGLLAQPWPAILALISGALGTFAIWVKTTGATEGVTERLRGEALQGFADRARNAIDDYLMRRAAIADGTPLPGYPDDPTAVAALQTQRDELETERASLAKFVYQQPKRPGS